MHLVHTIVRIAQSSPDALAFVSRAFCQSTMAASRTGAVVCRRRRLSVIAKTFLAHRLLPTSSRSRTNVRLGRERQICLRFLRRCLRRLSRSEATNASGSIRLLSLFPSFTFGLFNQNLESPESALFP